MSTDLARRLRRNASPPELAMWRMLWPLRQEGWHFRRQMQLGPYYVDFVCVNAGLVIEIDGDSHALTEDSDRTRDDYLSARGLLVLRFSNHDVMNNAEGVYQSVVSTLTAARATGDTPTPDPSPQGGGRRKGKAAPQVRGEGRAEASP